MNKGNKNKKTKVGNRKAGSRTQGEMSNTHPPQMNLYQLDWNKVLRFVCTTAQVNSTISYEQLVNTILFSATATQAYRVFDFVKIKRVSIWAPGSLDPAATGAFRSITCSVQFLGTTTAGNADLHSDTSMSIYPACVHARPSKSVAQFYQNNSNLAFQLNCPVGSVIDVQVSMRDSQNNATAATNASVGATVGGVFYRGLDGLPAATTTMPPVGGVPSF